ncbi:MAG: TolC family protein [Bacteroidales bacterium]|nr:TolC family protein [Bacteroidales bacterium]
MTNRIFIHTIALAALLLPVRGAARELSLTLDDAIAMARVKSVDAAVALDELKTAYWQWRSYRAERLPEITLSATLPSYNDRYTSYMNEAGEYSFVRTHNLDAQAELSINQNIPLTGGSVSLSTSLDYMRQFEDGGSNRFLTIPVALTLQQPIFGVNSFKWDSRIEPVRFQEAKAAFLSATEDMAQTTVNYFFTLVMSYENVAIASQNLDNANKLYAVAVEKRKMGSISENDLRQMELNVLDARSDLTECRSTLKSDMFALRSYLDLGEDVEIVPVVPESVPVAQITYSDALERALANNKFAKNIIRRQLEADYEVAKAKGDLRQIKLYAQAGFTGTDHRLGDAYSRLRGNQLIEVGLSIPLVDWGKRRGKVKVAESNRRVTESRLRQESLDFNQELFVLVERFGNQQEQLRIAERANEIAGQRYTTNFETFMIGKISTLDLNDSQTKKDESKRRYINELYKYWNYWYRLRSLTLYDYEHHDNINADIDKICRM